MKNALSIDVRGSMRPILMDLDRVAQTCVPPATVSALNKTARHVVVLAKREIAASIGVPQKAIAKKLAIGKASRRKLNAAVFLKHRPINPWYVSAARARKEAKAAGGWALKPGHVSKPQSRRGAKWWQMGARQGGNERGGNTFPKGLVLKRKGIKRYPTQSVGIPIPGAGAIVRKHVNGSGAFFSRTFAHELQYRIDKKRTSMAAAESEAA